MFKLITLAALVAIAAAGTTKEGLAWLEENGKKDGIVTLPSGLQYKVLKEGNEGGLTPKANSPCSCHYR